MAFGNPDVGLLKEIINVIHRHADENIYDTDWITQKVRESGFWNNKDAQTPERTVNSYFSQNTHIFERISKNKYRLRRKYWVLEIDFQQIQIEDELAGRELVPIEDLEKLQAENEKLRELNNKLLQLINQVRNIVNISL